ncbi:MAG: AAA family ATPase [Vicingaceae bacterium]
MLNRIAIVGPEASGKSELTKKLATHFDTSFAPEFAREYLSRIGLDYKKLDLLKIALGQIEEEEKAIKHAKEWVFFDTNLLVIKVWSLFKYNSIDARITYFQEEREYDLHLLLRPDLEYKDDPLRENPSLADRETLFNIYKEELIASNERFEIVEGNGENRLKNALAILHSTFN